MTTRLAIVLAIVIGGLIALDHFENDSAALLFLAKKGVELISFMAFWR